VGVDGNRDHGAACRILGVWFTHDTGAVDHRVRNPGRRPAPVDACVLPLGVTLRRRVHRARVIWARVSAFQVQGVRGADVTVTGAILASARVPAPLGARDVAQFGSAHGWGSWGRGFKSRRPDQDFDRGCRRHDPRHRYRYTPSWSSGQDASLSRRRSPVRIRSGVPANRPTDLPFHQPSLAVPRCLSVGDALTPGGEHPARKVTPLFRVMVVYGAAVDRT
jgi:hypothetical protein